MSTPYREQNRTTLHLAIWTIAWVATLAAARFAPWQSPTVTWIAIGVNLAVGAGVIIAFTRYLRAVDDLDRKIMLDALGITLGVAAVAGFGWIVASDAALLPESTPIAAFPAALGVVFIVAVIAGRVRYR